MSPMAASLGRLPAARRSKLGWCLAVAVAGHAAMAAAMLSPSTEVQPDQPVRAVQVRLVPASALPGSDAGPKAPREAAPQGPIRPATASVPRRQGPAAGVAATAAPVEALYLPRDALTVPPKPVGPVAVDYPTFDGEADHYSAEFDLFIDESGSVVRVVGATPDLPGILGDAVREAFLGARFSPGEVDGRAVRSRIRIEVTFDSRRSATS